MLPKGALLFSSRAPVGYVAIASNPVCTNQGFKSFVLPSGFDPRFGYYYLRHIKPIAEAMATGTTFKELSGAAAAKLPFVIAPLAEQKRIADKLEAVLGRVDACRARLDRVPALLKRFRQSVLAAATSGKLTEEWREGPLEYAQTFVEYPYSHTISGPVGWTLTNFGNLCDLIGGSQPPKATFVQEESPSVIRLIQIRDYKSDKHKIFIPRKLARRFCSKTDVMIGRYGPPIFQILRGLEGAYNVALMKAQPKEARLDTNYLFYWLQQDVLLRYIESGSDRTAGQDGIRKELVESYPFFLPPLPEQQEIVRRVEALFALADRIEARLAVVRKTADRLTPSVLAKAFRGELVPQDPNDEPASVLLERLQSQAAPQPARAPRKKRASKASVHAD
jgi:type I restriction enzyme S subunit